MKFLLIKVTVFFLLIISFSEKTFSKEFRAIYKIEIGSINIGSLDWVINIGTDKTSHAAATTVTNIEYEESEQDKKRRIRLLDPGYVSVFVSSYLQLIKE